MRLALWDIAVPLLCRTEREGPRDQGDDAQSKHLEDTAVNLKGAVELPDLGLTQLFLVDVAYDNRITGVERYVAHATTVINK